MMEQNATANQQELQDRRAQIAGLKADAEQAEVRMRAARKIWEELRSGLKPGDAGAPFHKPRSGSERTRCL